MKKAYIFIIILILLIGAIFIYNLKKRTIVQPPVKILPQSEIQPLRSKEPDMRFETKDRNEDGKPDIWLYYDENNQHIRSSADRNYDGKPDYWRYLSKGKIDREEGDIDFDGKLDTYTYYSEGLKVRAERDSNNDGKVDLFVYYQGNQIVGVEKDTDFDGKIDERIGKLPAE